MSVLVANESPLKKDMKGMISSCDFSMKRKLEGLLQSETEQNIGIHSKEVYSKKRRRLCKDIEDFLFGDSEEENFEVEDVTDDEDYEIPRAKRSSRRKRSGATKRNVVKKNKSMRVNVSKSVAKKSIKIIDKNNDFVPNDQERNKVGLSNTKLGSLDSHDLPSSSPQRASYSPNSSDSTLSTDSEENCATKSTKKTVEKREKHFKCHQCKKTDRPAVVPCLKCKEMQYCMRCIKQWYPQDSEVDIAQACPFCRKVCNCNECLHSSDIFKTFKRDLFPQEEAKHLTYLVGSLLPFISKINQEQSQEVELESKILGIALTEVNIQETSCSDDERIYCNHCATSIFDLHRSCPKCCFELCLSCCQEIRQGRLLGGPEIVPFKYSDRGYDYIHGDGPIPSCSAQSTDPLPTLSIWLANDNGSIPCPSKDRGGCGDGVLELRRILPKSWMRSLEARAKLLVEDCGIEQTLSSRVSLVCEAGSRRYDAHLYCPSSKEMLASEGMVQFRKHWANGEPVIVRDTLSQTLGLSWEPMVMSRALCENVDSNIKAIDCLANCEKLILHNELTSRHSCIKLQLS